MSKPTITYQRPTHSVDINRSIYFDDYTEYVKNKDTQDYAAAVVGSYIEEASNQQREAINELGNKVGLGLDYLRNETAHQKQELAIINRNLKLSLDQQRSINLNLEKIQYLIALPDAEKVRIRHIELGLKYYSNAETNDAFYDDAIREFEKALELRPEDYFVLYKLGYIYLYAPNHIDLNKSIQYFEKCIKYSVIEADQVAKEIYSKYLQNVRETHDVGKYVKSNALNESAFAHYILGDDSKAYNLQKEAYETLPNLERLFYAIKYGSKCDMVDDLEEHLNACYYHYPKVLYLTLFDLDIISNKTYTEKIGRSIDKYIDLFNDNRNNYFDEYGLYPESVIENTLQFKLDEFDNFFDKIRHNNNHQQYVDYANEEIKKKLKVVDGYLETFKNVNPIYYKSAAIRSEVIQEVKKTINEIRSRKILLKDISAYIAKIEKKLEDDDVLYISGDIHPLGLIASNPIAINPFNSKCKANRLIYLIGTEVIAYGRWRGGWIQGGVGKIVHESYSKFGFKGWQIPSLRTVKELCFSIFESDNRNCKRFCDSFRKLIDNEGYVLFAKEPYRDYPKTLVGISTINDNEIVSEKRESLIKVISKDYTHSVWANPSDSFYDKEISNYNRKIVGFDIVQVSVFTELSVLPARSFDFKEGKEVLKAINSLKADNKIQDRISNTDILTGDVRDENLIMKNITNETKRNDISEKQGASQMTNTADSFSTMTDTKSEKTEPETVKEIRDEIETTVSARNVALVIVAICLIRVLGLFSFGWTWIWYVVSVFFALMIINFQRDLKKYKRKLEELVNDRSDSKNPYDHIKSFIDKNWDAILSMDFPLVNIERKGEILFQIVDCNSMDLVEEKGKYLGIHVAFDPTDRNSSSLEENMKNSQLSTKFSHESNENGISIYTKCYSEHKKELIADVKLIITEVFEQDLLEITLSMDE